MVLNRILTLIEERQDELYELLSSLIKINSESFRSYGNEQAIAEHIHKLCVELGLEADIYSPLDIDGFTDHPDYMPGRNLENRYNVTACWRGKQDTKSLRYMGIKAGNDGMDLGVGRIHFVFYTDKTKDEIYDELAKLETELAARLEPLGIIGDGFVPATRFFHYVFCEPDSEDVKLMLDASRQATGRELLVCGSCLSDLSVISKYGSSRAYGFGAGRDFSVQGGAHQPNEFIECDKLLEYTKTIAAYVIKVLG